MDQELTRVEVALQCHSWLSLGTSDTNNPRKLVQGVTVKINGNQTDMHRISNNLQSNIFSLLAYIQEALVFRS